jgi:ArsR family transcriptional regulator
LNRHIDYGKRADLLKALAHPVRLQIVHDLLKNGCRNVRCMEIHIGMSQSCISQHLQRLRAAGVVAADRVGNEVYYRAASPEVAALVAALMKEEATGYVV